jgi:NitT/TauT family transport system substrate-binding protein
VKNYLFLVTFILLFSSCSNSSHHNHTLKISTTTWIGYTPLFYAKEKGWLEEANIKLINVVSLSENIYLYKSGNSDAFCGTQYEYSVLKDRMPTLMPIILFDRSNGGDIIMSNTSIEALQNSKQTIDTYLEMDSVNFTLLNDFIQKYNINEKRINYMNRDQNEIKELKNTTQDKQILIVTYIPFDTKLKKNGFHEILSTKNGLDLFVVDAMFTQQEELVFHKEQFEDLRDFNNRAITALHNDPKEFYQTIKFHINELTYEEFTEALGDVEWINSTKDKHLMNRMKKASFPTKDIL